MGVKDFIEKIINRFRRPKQPLLTGNIESGYDGFSESENFRKACRENVSIDAQNTYGTKETLDECILEYISQYIKQIEIGTDEDVSYKALTRMFYEGQEEIGGNAENQDKLKQKIHKSTKYRIDGQYSSSGKPIFYHISQNTPESQKITDRDQDTTRIYLNCERRNIAILTGEILKKLDKIDKCAFKMKFMAESDESEESKRYQRNEKIVIYVDDDLNKERVVSSLIDLKNERPDLFSPKKKLPLMPKINGFIGCTKQGDTIVSTPLYEIKYARTYNSKLATIMEDCMISSIREISVSDERIFDAMDGYYGEDPKEYVKAFKIMDPEQIKQVVEMFKIQLISCCEKSQIPIDVGKEAPNQQR